MKKFCFLFFSLILIFSLTACNKDNSSILSKDNVNSFVLDTGDTNYYESVHIEALKVLEAVSIKTGFSIVGSDGDIEKLKYIEKRFSELGLSNINTVDLTLDGWELSDIVMKVNCECADEGIMTIYNIAAYPREFDYNSEVFRLMNVVGGTQEDYDKIDESPEYKGILIHDSEDFFAAIDLAYEKKAAFVMYVFSSTIDSSMAKLDMTSDYAGYFPKDIPIFVISSSSYTVLKNAIEDYEVTEIRLTGSSKFTKDVTGTFLMGDIVGTNPNDIVYITANRDTIFQGFMSSCQNVGEMFVLIEQLKQHNVQPKNTLRFLVTTGQEWGSMEGGYNIGITKYIDEYARKEKIKAVLVIDGAKPLSNTMTLNTESSAAFKDFLNEYNGKFQNIRFDNRILDILDPDLSTRVTEGYTWSEAGYDVIIQSDNITTDFGYIENSTSDKPSLGTDSDIANFLVRFYYGVIMELAKR